MQNSATIVCMEESWIYSVQTATDMTDILWVVFSSSYPLLPATPTTAVWHEFRMMGCFGKVCVGVKEVEPEAGGGRGVWTQSAWINSRMMFLSDNCHLLLQIKLWPPHTDGAYKGLGAKSSFDKIFYLKFKMVIPFSVLKAFLNPWICVIWYYNACNREAYVITSCFLIVTS